jgi:hypothetical protein
MATGASLPTRAGIFLVTTAPTSAVRPTQLLSNGYWGRNVKLTCHNYKCGSYTSTPFHGVGPRRRDVMLRHVDFLRLSENKVFSIIVGQIVPLLSIPSHLAVLLIYEHLQAVIYLPLGFLFCLHTEQL